MIRAQGGPVERNTAEPGRVRKWMFQAAAGVAVVGVIFLAVAVLGRLARDRLRDLDQPALAFAAVRCPAPPGLGREEFLSEVQYLAGLPGRIRLGDGDVARRLAEGFAVHPWVERVDRVEVRSPADVRVALTFRAPVLAVRWTRASTDPGVRAVDRRGILLPTGAATERLPVLVTARAPAGPAGTPWGDAAVTAAAATVGYLARYGGQVGLETVEVDGAGLLLRMMEGTRIRWGKPPGEEASDECPAEEKVRRILEIGRRPAGKRATTAGAEIDVRIPGGRAASPKAHG